MFQTSKQRKLLIQRVVLGGALALGMTACLDESSPDGEIASAQASLMVTEQAQIDAIENGLADGQGTIVEESSETPQPYIMAVDWEEAAGFAKADLDLLPDKVIGPLATVPLPVLVPNSPALYIDPVATTGDNWYALSLVFEDHSVLIQASRVGFARNGVNEGPFTEDHDADPGALHGDFRISRNSLIAGLTFQAFGLVYTLEVECENPDSNKLCTADDYIIELANSLAIAGGAQ